MVEYSSGDQGLVYLSIMIIYDAVPPIFNLSNVQFGFKEIKTVDEVDDAISMKSRQNSTKSTKSRKSTKESSSSSDSSDDSSSSSDSSSDSGLILFGKLIFICTFQIQTQK